MHIEESLKVKLDKLSGLSEKTMGSALGIEFTSFTKDEIKAVMPVDERTVQPFGILHGGASVALAETVASIGAWLNLEDDAQQAVGIEINANHLKSVKKGGRVHASATPVHRGNQIHIWEIKIEDDEGRLVCISRCTLAIVER